MRSRCLGDNVTIQNHKVKSLQEFIAIIDTVKKAFDHKDIWYRGHSSPKYKLEPTLHRNNQYTSIETVKAVEKKMLSEYSFKLPSYDFGSRMENWDLLFLMQHYGMPTRMLDWSSSPQIALFFASLKAKPETGAVVWCLNPAIWNKGLLHDISGEEVIYTTNDSIIDPYHPMSDEHKRGSPLAIEGVINNPRISAQRGKFVIFGPQLKTMEDQVNTCPIWKAGSKPLIKISIAKSYVEKIHNQLRDFGVTYSTIYPDLEGLALEIKKKHGF